MSYKWWHYELCKHITNGSWAFSVSVVGFVSRLYLMLYFFSFVAVSCNYYHICKLVFLYFYCFPIEFFRFAAFYKFCFVLGYIETALLTYFKFWIKVLLRLCGFLTIITRSSVHARIRDGFFCIFPELPVVIIIPFKVILNKVDVSPSSCLTHPIWSSFISITTFAFFMVI